MTFWVDPDFFKNQPGTESTKRRPRYKKTMIQTGWLLKTLYHLTFRSLEGFFHSLLKMIGADLISPDDSLFCKGSGDCTRCLRSQNLRGGEWKTHKHRPDQKRRWIKLHVSVDPKTGECISTHVTNEKEADCKQVYGKGFNNMGNAPRRDLFSRLKTTFGERPACKKWENQLIETNFKVKILNQITTA